MMRALTRHVRMSQFPDYVKCYRQTATIANNPEVSEIKKIKTVKQLELDEKVASDLENNLYHPRLHPGIVRKKVDQLPSKLLEAMETVAEDRKKSDLFKGGQMLMNRLWGRSLPPEERDYIENMKKEIENVQLAMSAVPEANDEDERRIIQEKVVTRRLKDIIHPWHPLGVTHETCLQYLFARTPPEYCILHKIFTEIRHADPDFIPSTLFDFGSGVASGYWAVKEVWQQPLREVYNVDSNMVMNELARRLLYIAGEKSTAEEGIFFRQFFPLSFTPTYDIALSAFSLLELPSFKERVEAVSRMWSKTEKYLVIVEDGTNAGYKAVMEARNLVIHLENSEVEDMSQQGVHVVAPCPHEFVCPRFTKDDTPCNFKISYLKPQFLQGKQERSKHLYSYVILKKGERSNCSHQWSRCVRETLLRKQTVYLKLCTPEGQLENVELLKAYNCRNAYKCAKHTDWGDLLPGKIQDCDKSLFTKSRTTMEGEDS